MLETSLENGTDSGVSTVQINGKNIIVTGRWIRRAVVQDEAWLETEIEDPGLCLQVLAQGQLRVRRPDLFTFSQKPSAPVPRYSFPMEWDSWAVVRLGSFKAWWDKLPQESRKNVRRAEKRGVEVRLVQFTDQLIREIWGVHNDSPVCQGKRNRYYGLELEEIKRHHSAFLDRSDLVGAYYGDELIGFLHLVHRQEVASILFLDAKPSHHDKRPANALLAKAVEICEASGVSHLTYGMYCYGKKRESTLLEFKRRNGFEEVLVPRFNVPITKWGALCLRLGLHRGIVAMLPHGVVGLFGNVRNMWYGFRFQA